jgi:divalent metal cation (Fe/Co/Zn/Cd) transporter
VSSPQADRNALLRAGLWLSVASIVWGIGSGAWAIVTSLGSHSLSVLGLGLNLAADVSGSVFVGWRLWGELRGVHESERPERVASLVVGGALAVLALFLAVEAVAHLASGYRPHPSAAALAAAGASLVVLVPLGLAKRRVGRQLASAALEGDGSISLLGASVAALAFVGSIFDLALGWWWADAVAALVVAVAAAVESIRALRAGRTRIPGQEQ